MNIAQVLARKGSSVVTIGPAESIKAAVAALAEHGIGALVVSADGRHVDGILSERDIVRALHEREQDLLGLAVEALMSSSVHTCVPADSVESVMALMTEQRFRHVPVLDENGELAGMMSIGDVVKTRIDELEHDRKELVDYINAR